MKVNRPTREPKRSSETFPVGAESAYKMLKPHPQLMPPASLRGGGAGGGSGSLQTRRVRHVTFNTHGA